jgi:hypothetical protein
MDADELSKMPAIRTPQNRHKMFPRRHHDLGEPSFERVDYDGARDTPEGILFLGRPSAVAARCIRVRCGRLV